MTASSDSSMGVRAVISDCGDSGGDFNCFHTGVQGYFLESQSHSFIFCHLQEICFSVTCPLTCLSTGRMNTLMPMLCVGPVPCPGHMAVNLTNLRELLPMEETPCFVPLPSILCPSPNPVHSAPGTLAASSWLSCPRAFALDTGFFVCDPALSTCRSPRWCSSDQPAWSIFTGFLAPCILLGRKRGCSHFFCGHKDGTVKGHSSCKRPSPCALPSSQDHFRPRSSWVPLLTNPGLLKCV